MVYFKNIYSVSRSILVGMWITLRYFFRPSTIVTIQYPRVNDEIPARHRGLHILETEKCIMCFQCAEACPVDCIDIEGVRGGAFEGAYQGKGAVMSRFTVDYGLCLFCNLCVEPCPADCIHLGPEYDLSSFSREEVTRNLLTNKSWSKEDREFVGKARDEIARIEAEAKAAKAAKKKKKPAKGEGGEKKLSAKERILAKKKAKEAAAAGGGGDAGGGEEKPAKKLSAKERILAKRKAAEEARKSKSGD